MSDAVRRKWDDHYRRRLLTAESDVSDVLAENAHLLPMTGTALDLACGLGGNALFLAHRGLRVTAWDISPIAVGALQQTACRAKLAVTAETRDLTQVDWEAHRFDVIVVARYLDRALMPRLASSLSDHGLIFIQTFTRDKLGCGGPSNPEFLLRDNELLLLFPSLRVRFYREDSHCGNLGSGNRREALYVGEKWVNERRSGESNEHN
jgi:SAM-dependent methyltransferase